MKCHLRFEPPLLGFCLLEFAQSNDRVLRGISDVTAGYCSESERKKCLRILKEGVVFRK